MHIYTVAVSYDGFDPNENTQFLFDGRRVWKDWKRNNGSLWEELRLLMAVHLRQLCFFVGFKEKEFIVDHGIIGSSDMDEVGKGDGYNSGIYSNAYYV